MNAELLENAQDLPAVKTVAMGNSAEQEAAERKEAATLKKPKPPAHKTGVRSNVKQLPKGKSTSESYLLYTGGAILISLTKQSAKVKEPRMTRIKMVISVQVIESLSQKSRSRSNVVELNCITPVRSHPVIRNPILVRIYSQHVRSVVAKLPLLVFHGNVRCPWYIYYSNISP